jgi:inner membrane protein involved in colicin E2 resistance
MTIALNTSFVTLTSQKFTNTISIFWSMIISYLSIYFLSQSSEYNLLFISIMSFIIVAIMMVVSHIINHKK